MAQEHASNQDQPKDILRKTADKAKDRLRKEAVERKDELDTILSSLRNAAVALDTFRNPQSSPNDTTVLQMRKDGVLLRQMAYNQALLGMASELASTPEFQQLSRQEIIAFITNLIDECLSKRPVQKKVEDTVSAPDVVIEAKLEPRIISSTGTLGQAKELPILPTKEFEGLNIPLSSPVLIHPPVKPIQIPLQLKRGLPRRNPKIGRTMQERAVGHPEKTPGETVDQAAEALLRELTDDKARYDAETVWTKLRENYRAREKEGDRAVQEFITALHTKLQGGDLQFFKKLNADLEPVKAAGISVLGEDTDDRNWKTTVENGVVTKTKIATLSDIVTKPKERVTVPISLRLQPDAEIGDDKLEATWLEIHGQLAQAFGLPAEMERARITAGMPPLIEVTDPQTGQRVGKRREVEIFRSQIHAGETPSITVTNADFLTIRKNALDRAGKSYQPFFRNSVEAIHQLEAMKKDEFLGFMAAFAASSKDRVADTIGGVNALFGSETAAEMEKTIRASWGSLNIAKEATSETVGAMLGGGAESMMFFVAAGAAGKAIRLPGALARFAPVSAVMPKVPLLVVTVLPGANQAYTQAKGSLEQQVRHDPKLASLSAAEKRSYVERWARGSAWFGAVIAVSESLLGLGTVTNRVLNGSQGLLTGAINRVATNPAIQQRLTALMSSPAMQRALQGIQSSEQLGRMGTYAGVILNEAGEEGLQEVMEQFLGNVNQRLLADPEADISEGVLQSMLLGSLFGVAGRYYAEGANAVAGRLGRNPRNPDDNAPPLQSEVPDEEKDEEKKDKVMDPPPPPPPPPVHQSHKNKQVVEKTDEEKRRDAQAKEDLVADYQAKQEAEKTPEQLEKERQQAKEMMAELARRQREGQAANPQPTTPDHPNQAPTPDPDTGGEAKEPFGKGRVILESALVNVVDLIQAIESLKLSGLETVSQRLSALVTRLGTLVRGWDEALMDWEKRAGRRLAGLASDGVETVTEILAILGSVPASVRESWNKGVQGRTETWEAMTERFRGILATMTAWQELLPKKEMGDDAEDPNDTPDPPPDGASETKIILMVEKIVASLRIRLDNLGSGLESILRDANNLVTKIGELSVEGLSSAREALVARYAKLQEIWNDLHAEFAAAGPEIQIRLKALLEKVQSMMAEINRQFGLLADSVAKKEEKPHGLSNTVTEDPVLNRKSLDYITHQGEFSPQALLDFLKSDPTLAEDYGFGPIVREGYDLETHTRTMMLQFETYFSSHPLPGGIDIGFLRVVLALHDIGKPNAIRYDGHSKNQHAFTEGYLDKYLRLLGYTENEIGIAESIILGDPIGEYLQARARGDAVALDQVCQKIERMRLRSGLSAEDHWNLMLIYYMTDASSYTTDAGGSPTSGTNRVFDFDRPNRSVRLKPDYQQYLEDLAARRKALNSDPILKLENAMEEKRRFIDSGKPIPEGFFNELLWTHRTDIGAMLAILNSGHLRSGSARGINFLYGQSSNYGDIQVYMKDDVANLAAAPEAQRNIGANLGALQDWRGMRYYSDQRANLTDAAQHANYSRSQGSNHVTSQPYLFIGQRVGLEYIQKVIVPEHVTNRPEWGELERSLQEREIPYEIRLGTGHDFLSYIGMGAIFHRSPKEKLAYEQIRDGLAAKYKVTISTNEEYLKYLEKHLREIGVIHMDETFERAYDRLNAQGVATGYIRSNQSGGWMPWTSPENHFREQQDYFRESVDANEGAEVRALRRQQGGHSRSLYMSRVMVAGVEQFGDRKNIPPTPGKQWELLIPGGHRLRVEVEPSHDGRLEFRVFMPEESSRYVIIGQGYHRLSRSPNRIMGRSYRLLGQSSTFGTTSNVNIEFTLNVEDGQLRITSGNRQRIGVEER